MVPRHYIPVIAWVLVICALYSIPGFDLLYQDPWNFLTLDKLAHVFLFAVLVDLLIVAFRKQYRYRRLRLHARKWSLLVAIGLGGVLEFYQGTYFIMRTSDPLDFAANAIGAFMGLLMFRIVYGKELWRA